MKILCALIIYFLATLQPVRAKNIDAGESGLSLPRMVSLRSGDAKARSGPSTNYPVEWIYRQKGAPVEIINEFGIWRQIRDWEGSESWVHKSLLTGRRFVRVMAPGENNIYDDDDSEASVIAKVEDGVIGEIKECTRGNKFCLIKFDTIEGWIPRDILFGIYETEDID